MTGRPADGASPCFPENSGSGSNGSGGSTAADANANAVLAAESVRLQTQAALRGPATCLPLHVIAETGSTNADLLDAGTYPDQSACVLMALTQTRGRGRSGRRWQSDEGTLTFSVRWTFRRRVQDLLGLPLAVAVATTQALEDLAVSGVQIKWPNDLLRQGRKVGGVLVELGSDGRAVIGIGLNVQLDATLAAGLDQGAADIQPQQGTALTRIDALAALLNRLAPMLGTFDESGFAAFQSDWMARACWRGRAVRLGSAIEGVFVGADHDGAALIDKDGSVQRHLVGDLSLRAL